MHSLLCALQFSVLFSLVISIAIDKANEKEIKAIEEKYKKPDKFEKTAFVDYLYSDYLNEDYRNEYQDESLIKTNETTNSTTNGTDILQKEKPKCRMCTVREEQRKHRIEIIKNRISHALKLDTLGMPNTTRNKLPNVPSFLRLKEKYENKEMQADSPSSAQRQKMRYQAAQEEYGQPERTYTFARKPPDNLVENFPNTIFFDVPLSSEKEANKALLWAYISDKSVIGRNMTEIYVYAIDPPGKSGGPPTKREIGRRKRHYKKGAGWHHFNIISEVKKWNEKEELNLGIIVEALDEEKRNLIVMPPTTGLDEGSEPLLDIRTSLKKNKRAKRSTDLYCDDREVTACCRYPLEVDFIEFGWDFVIGPLKYAAYYCAGECSGEHLEENFHTHVINQAVIPTRPAPASALNNVGPCCTPTHMTDLAMLFFDHNSNVVYTRLPRMKVDRCGCA